MKETEYLKLYIDELSQIRPCSTEENLTLLGRMASGDDDARSRLIEGNLHIVPEIVTEYEGSGAPVSDMLQEGNMALMEALEAISGKVTDPESFLAVRVRGALEEFIRLEGVESLAAHKLEDEANRLINLTRDFETEHERTATLSELAQLMGLPEDEVENIMRISYSAISLGDSNSTGQKPAKDPLRDGWGE